MPKRKDAATPQFHFDGFDSPNTTPVPDVLFDVLAPELTEGELRVLLYVIRRTYGFKKHADDISLKQLVEGITTRDGQVLDRGAGIAKSAASRAVKGLIEKGIITATRNRSEEKGDEPTTYALRFKGERAEVSPEGSPAAPVFSKRTRGGPPKEHARVLQENPQETVKQETGLHHSNIRNATHEKLSVVKIADGAGTRDGAGAPGADPRPRPNTLATAPPRRLVKPVQLTRRAAGEPEAIGATLTRRRGRSSSTSEDREVIVAYLADFARELNDRAPLRVSVSRALNLLARSGLPREVFLQKLYEARSLTKEYSASIQTTVKRDGAPLPVKAKMAYFFAVLEDLLGFKDDRPDDGVAPPLPH